MGIRNFPVISIGPATGVVSVNVPVTGVAVALPTMVSGGIPKYVYCAVYGGTADNLVTVEPTFGAVGSVLTGFPLITNTGIGIILNVHGYSHIGADSPIADSELHIVPLEDF